MLQRFALLEPAVMATLMTKEVRRGIKDVYTLSGEDVNNIEKAIETLQPLETITTVLCDATNPTVSLIILPLKNIVYLEEMSRRLFIVICCPGMSILSSEYFSSWPQQLIQGFTLYPSTVAKSELVCLLNYQ